MVREKFPQFQPHDGMVQFMGGSFPVGQGNTEMQNFPLEEKKTERQASFAMIHRSILAGVPRQFGLWDADNREYRGAGGRSFGIFSRFRPVPP